jgi:phosphoglycolate phosphatase
MKRPLGIVFDLDGTLLNTLDDLADSVNIVLSECGLPTHPVDAYKYFVGDGASVLMTRVIPEAKLTPELHASCLARFREVYAAHWAGKTEPYEGITGLLAELSKRGIPMAILSNKPHDATLACVHEFLKEMKFAVVQGQVEGLARKPDPAGAFAVAREMNLAPGQIWYVGDTSTDMQTAVSAGMYPVGVTWGFRTKDELIEYGAQAIIDAPHQLIALLDGKGIA